MVKFKADDIIINRISGMMCKIVMVSGNQMCVLKPLSGPKYKHGLQLPMSMLISKWELSKTGQLLYV